MGLVAHSERTEVEEQKKRVNIRLPSDGTLTCHTYAPLRRLSVDRWLRITAGPSLKRHLQLCTAAFYTSFASSLSQTIL